MPENMADPAQTAGFIPVKVLPVDTLPEAGRKILLAEFARIHPAKTAAEKSESCVSLATIGTSVRQMRGALKLLKREYKPKTLRLHRRSLRQLSRALGNLRMLDTLIADFQGLAAQVDAAQQDTLKQLVDKLVQQRAAAGEELAALLDSKAQRRLFKALSAETVPPVADGKIQPAQVRHLLPSMVYDRLAELRACDEAVPGMDAGLALKLRSRVSRFQNVMSLFGEMLGKPVADVIDEVNALQESLDGLYETTRAPVRLSRWINTGKKKYLAILEAYLQQRDARTQSLMAEFKDHWTRFNSKKMQQKLATALISPGEN